MSFLKKLKKLVQKLKKRGKQNTSKPKKSPATSTNRDEKKKVPISGRRSKPVAGRDDLEKKIIKAIGQSKKTAKAIASQIRESKNLVNSKLYSNRGSLFLKEGDSSPLWYLANPDLLKDKVSTQVPPVKDRDPYPWQAEAFEAWLKSDEVGVIEAVTGTGKTQLGIMALGKVTLDRGKGVVLVPTRELQDQWVAELTTRGFQSVGRLGNGFHDTLSNCEVLVAVAASASIYYLDLPRGTKGVLVADEVHRYACETWKKALEEVFQSRLGLTATFERFDKAHAEILLPYFKKIIFSYSYTEAARDQIIAKFKLATLGVNFNKREETQYDEETREMNRAIQHLVNHHQAPDPYGESTTFVDFLNYISKGKLANELRLNMAISKFWKPFSERRKILAETKAKYDALEKLVPAIMKSNGAIAFTATIESAVEAAKVLQTTKVPCGLIHSEMKKEERKTVLADFKQKKLKAIVAVRVLDEGIDVPEADLGIIIGASKDRRQMIQRMGRVLRRKKDSRLAKFVILYVNNTGEDPERGGHEAFLDSILPVAKKENTQNFGSRTSTKKITEFLS